MTARYTVHVGDCLESLRAMPAASVHCCVTSPPYWGLRDYGTDRWDGGDPKCDHVKPSVANRGAEFRKRAAERDYDPGSNFANYGDRNAARTDFESVCVRCGARRARSQLGLESTPAEYVAGMVAVFLEVRRVLREDGTLWLNMGDGYASGDRSTYRSSVSENKGHEVQNDQARPRTPPGLKPKDLCGMPWRLAFALQAGGWYLRQDIIWAKPNPMPESVTDRCTKAHEYLFLLSKSARYYFDSEAIKEKAATGWNGSKFDGSRDLETMPTTGRQPRFGGSKYPDAGSDGPYSGNEYAPNGFRNKRSVWTIATQSYDGAHFATYPEDLVLPCILAGTSEHGCCPTCLAPYKRRMECFRNGKDWNANNRAGGDRLAVGQSASDSMPDTYQPPRTIGWDPSCRCPPAPTVPPTVLDPFAGSGTTGAVALRHGRHALLLELNPDYLPLIHQRCSNESPLFTSQSP